MYSVRTAELTFRYLHKKILFVTLESLPLISSFGQGFQYIITAILYHSYLLLLLSSILLLNTSSLLNSAALPVALIHMYVFYIMAFIL